MTIEATTSDRRDSLVVPGWVRRLAELCWAFVGASIALGLILVVLASIREVVVPLVIAVFAAVGFAPAVDHLERRHLPRAAGAAVVTAFVVASGIALVLIVTVGVVDRADELGDQLESARVELEQALDDLGAPSAFPVGGAEVESAGRYLSAGATAEVSSLIDSAVGFASGLFLSLILLYYLLKDGRHFVAVAARRRTPQASAQTERIIARSSERIRSYSRGRTMLAALQAAFLWIVLAAMGVPLAGSIAIVNFVGGFVPYFGALIGSVFAVLVAVSDGGIAAGAWVLVIVLVMNLVLENLLEPRLIGGSLRMHPLVVLLVTVMGGLVAGLVGLVVAAPVAAIGSDLFAELRSSGFFGRPEARSVASGWGVAQPSTDGREQTFVPDD